MFGALFDQPASAFDLDDDTRERRRRERVDIDGGLGPRADREAFVGDDSLLGEHHVSTDDLRRITV